MEKSAAETTQAVADLSLDDKKAGDKLKSKK